MSNFSSCHWGEKNSLKSSPAPVPAHHPCTALWQVNTVGHVYFRLPAEEPVYTAAMLSCDVTVNLELAGESAAQQHAGSMPAPCTGGERGRCDARATSRVMEVFLRQITPVLLLDRSHSLPSQEPNMSYVNWLPYACVCPPSPIKTRHHARFAHFLRTAE